MPKIILGPSQQLNHVQNADQSLDQNALNADQTSRPATSPAQTASPHHQGFTVWLTGLSGAGKTTIGRALAARLEQDGCRVQRLDGDVVRQDLTADLGFSKADRNANIRRVGFVAEMLTRNGVIAVCSFISPYRDARNRLAERTGAFVEVFVDCPLEVCAERDVKGLYQQAMNGEIDNFTGISDPYEEPLDPDVTVHSHEQTVEECVQQIIDHLRQQGYFHA